MLQHFDSPEQFIMKNKKRHAPVAIASLQIVENRMQTAFQFTAETKPDPLFWQGYRACYNRFKKETGRVTELLCSVEEVD